MGEAAHEMVWQGLVLALWLSLPALAGGLAAALLAGFLRAVTAWSDPVLAHVPRVLAVGLAYVVAGPWIAAEVVAFARLAWGADS